VKFLSICILFCPALYRQLFVSVIDGNIFEMTENIMSFRSECLKIYAKNTFMMSFNTTVRQMTKMFQWPKYIS